MERSNRRFRYEGVNPINFTRVIAQVGQSLLVASHLINGIEVAQADFVTLGTIFPDEKSRGTCPLWNFKFQFALPVGFSVSSQLIVDLECAGDSGSGLMFKVYEDKLQFLLADS